MAGDSRTEVSVPDYLTRHPELTEKCIYPNYVRRKIREVSEQIRERLGIETVTDANSSTVEEFLAGHIRCVKPRNSNGLTPAWRDLLREKGYEGTELSNILRVFTKGYKGDPELEKGMETIGEGHAKRHHIVNYDIVHARMEELYAIHMQQEAERKQGLAESVIKKPEKRQETQIPKPKETRPNLSSIVEEVLIEQGRNSNSKRAAQYFAKIIRKEGLVRAYTEEKSYSTRTEVLVNDVESTRPIVAERVARREERHNKKKAGNNSLATRNTGRPERINIVNYLLTEYKSYFSHLHNPHKVAEFITWKIVIDKRLEESVHLNERNEYTFINADVKQVISDYFKFRVSLASLRPVDVEEIEGVNMKEVIGLEDATADLPELEEIAKRG